MNWLKTLRYLDFMLAAGSLAYGVVSGSLMWCAGGVCGLALASLNPTRRILARLLGIKRRSVR